MHKRQAIREAIFTLVATVPATVTQEKATEVPAASIPHVNIIAPTETVEERSVMGACDAWRDQRIVFEILTNAANGRAAVDAASDLEVAIAAALGTDPSLSSLVFVIAWQQTSIETSTEQEDIQAFLTSVWRARYEASDFAPV